MQKIKKCKIAIVATLIFSMLAIYGSVPTAKAVSLEMAKDTISDSDPSATGVTHTITLDMGTALSENQYVSLVFEAGIVLPVVGSIACPASTTASVNGQEVKCTVNAGQTLASTSVQTITITDAANPATSKDYSVTISTHEAGDAEIESSEVKIYIIEDVTVTAYVPATLTFSIATGTPDTTFKEPLTGTSSPTSIPFGTLDTSAKLMGQVITVSTNAADGFSVTVQQDGNLRNAGGADINSYSTTEPTAWAAPSADIGNDTTWGHMALTSDDADIFNPNDRYRGLDGTSPLTVFSHSGPVDGGTAGTAVIGYKLQISAMQEAGDYQNRLTYVCTPIF